MGGGEEEVLRGMVMEEEARRVAAVAKPWSRKFRGGRRRPWRSWSRSGDKRKRRGDWSSNILLFNMPQ